MFKIFAYQSLIYKFNVFSSFPRRPIEERVVNALGKYWHVEVSMNFNGVPFYAGFLKWQILRMNPSNKPHIIFSLNTNSIQKHNHCLPEIITRKSSFLTNQKRENIYVQ